MEKVRENARRAAVRCFLSVPLFRSGDVPEQMFWASASRRVACQRDGRGRRQGVLPRTRGMVSGHFALSADAWGLPSSGCVHPGRSPPVITPQLLGVNDVEHLFA
jgi:hypothetical protein